MHIGFSEVLHHPDFFGVLHQLVWGFLWKVCTRGFYGAIYPGVFLSTTPWSFFQVLHHFVSWEPFMVLLFSGMLQRLSCLELFTAGTCRNALPFVFLRRPACLIFGRPAPFGVFLGVLYHLYFYEFCMMELFLACFTILVSLGALYGFAVFWNATTISMFGRHHRAIPEESITVFLGSPAPFGCLGVLHHFYKLCTPEIFLSPPCTGIFGALYSGAFGELCSLGLFHHSSPFGYLGVLHSRLFQSLPLLEVFLIFSPWGFLGALHSGVFFLQCFTVLFFGNPLWFHCFLECYYTRHFLNASLHCP